MLLVRTLESSNRALDKAGLIQRVRMDGDLDIDKSLFASNTGQEGSRKKGLTWTSYSSATLRQQSMFDGVEPQSS